jgi:hypothetical protein
MRNIIFISLVVNPDYTLLCCYSIFIPLGEFVNCNEDVLKSTFGLLSGPTWSSPQHANGQAGGMQISS